jgi:site-specific recombinase XerD
MRRGEKAQRRFLEFFAATIRNKNTREAYYRGACKFFAWCEARGVKELTQVEPLLVAAFIEEEINAHQAQTVKQELAAIRKLFDYLVTGQIMPFNPASSVRGPSYSTDIGKTPVLSREDARLLLESIRSPIRMGNRICWGRPLRRCALFTVPMPLIRSQK